MSDQMSDAVRHCADRLKALGTWYKFSPNLPAEGCKDAASKRQRLGHEGIPLWDEMRSLLGVCKDKAGKELVFAAHCRADRQFNMSKLAVEVGVAGKVTLAPKEVAEKFGMAYGLVNPFLLPEEVPQIFDVELQNPFGYPGTVMTNAGSHEVSVEFVAAELVSRLPNARWANVATEVLEENERWGVRGEPPTIGILTGNPTRSGLELCEAIGAEVQRLLGRLSLGDVSMPPMDILSMPGIGISMEMNERVEPLRQALLSGVERLCASGAKIIVHPANTTSFFAPEMEKLASGKGARFISMAQSLVSYLKNLDVHEITLLGTRLVTDFSQPWSVYREALKGIKVHTPLAQGKENIHWDKIHALAFEVQQHGVTPLTLNWMRDLLRNAVPASCKHVVLAMTEFTPVVSQLKSAGRQGKILIDPMDIYAEEIAKEYLGIKT